MRRAIIAAALACASCVPASEALPPAGAFGFHTEPSPASRGEPFVTSDGWTIRIEKIAVQVNVSVSSENNSSGRYYGGSSTFLFDATQVVDVYARAVAVGPATGNVNLTGSYLGDGRRPEDDEDEDERTEVIGLSPEARARFRAPADAHQSSGSYGSYSGPSMLLAVRAEKAGRVVAFDLTLGVHSGYAESKATGEVRKDALVTVPMGIVAEAFFFDDKTRDLRFDGFAAADADQDGIVTGPELGSVLFQQVSSRGAAILVPR
jgi:hypothetical protein